MGPLLEVQDLSVHFPILGGVLKRPVGAVYAVSDVSFRLEKGETLGIVGESGCGKTTLGRAIVRLYPPTSGSVRFDGQDLTSVEKDRDRELRRDMQMIFQDPYASLNPRQTVRSILEEPLRIHRVGNRAARLDTVLELMQTVGLRPEDLYRYPHEFSGGQRQRIGIARALALGPRLVIADEPVSALDVSIQAQVLNLLVDLQNRLDLTYIFISHDLTVVKYISDRVAVMYLGRLVEIASSDDIYREPRHPYTRALLSSVPLPNPRRRAQGQPLEGDVPSPSDPPTGCAFHTRCPYVQDRCRQERPSMRPVTGNHQHQAACHFFEELGS